MRNKSGIQLNMITTNKLHTVELAFLAALLVSTPLSEALKNITWLCYVLTWVTVRFSSTKNWGGEWRTWDTIFLIWISSGFVVAMLTTVHHQEWNGAWDVLRFAGIAWLVSRSNYTRTDLTNFLAIAILATVAGTAYALWSWKVTGTRPNLEIHSVGFVNHTAIYLVLAAGSALSFLASKIWHNNHSALFATIVIVVALISATLITLSRGSVLTLLFLIPALSIALSDRRIIASIISIAILVAMTISASQLQLPIYDRLINTFTHHTINDTDIFSSSSIGYRDMTINVALTIWRQHPIQGVGLENYGVVDNQKTITNYMLDQNRVPPHSFGESLGSGHAHNLYANTLAERGLIGFIPVILVLIYWIKGLLTAIPINSSIYDSHYKVIWGSALTGWIVVTMNGLFNTTLHHEHGLLATFFLGAWISIIREKGG